MAKRRRVGPTDDWEQLRLLSRFPEQRAYELLRPVVLFGGSVSERSRQTGTPERTLYRQAARFDRAIRDLKAEHPPFRATEIADVCAVRFRRRPSPHTVKRILAEDPPPALGARRFPPYGAIADPIAARLAIIRLHSEGWAVKSIAAYLETARSTIYRNLQRWIVEGVAGLDDRSHARRDGLRKVTLPIIATVKELGETPRLGEFRVAAALRQLGIHLSPRTCGRILAKHRALYGMPREAKPPRERKPLPFAATRAHEHWCLGIRYIDHNLGPGKIYCLSVMDGYSRAILASMLSRSQDLVPVLLVLYTAMRAHGTPEALVTDSGGVFLANHIRRIYDALGIRKEEIARRQPWQNLIEANFGTQARMADYGFANAASWDGLLRVHEQWMDDYNAQMHWAHQRRDDGRRSPKDVLDGAVGRPSEEAALHRVFYSVRFGRVLGAEGYARFRHWKFTVSAALPAARLASGSTARS